MNRRLKFHKRSQLLIGAMHDPLSTVLLFTFGALVFTQLLSVCVAEKAPRRTDWPRHMTAISPDSKQRGSVDLAVSPPPVVIVVR